MLIQSIFKFYLRWTTVGTGMKRAHPIDDTIEDGYVEIDFAALEKSFTNSGWSEPKEHAKKVQVRLFDLVINSITY